MRTEGARRRGRAQADAGRRQAAALRPRLPPRSPSPFRCPSPQATAPSFRAPARPRLRKSVSCDSRDTSPRGRPCRAAPPRPRSSARASCRAEPTRTLCRSEGERCGRTFRCARRTSWRDLQRADGKCLSSPRGHTTPCPSRRQMKSQEGGKSKRRSRSSPAPSPLSRCRRQCDPPSSTLRAVPGRRPRLRQGGSRAECRQST